MEHNTPADHDHYIKSKTSYCYLWKLLSPEKKWGVFEIYEGFKIYVIPMDAHNKPFIKTLGLKLNFKDGNTLCERSYPSESDKRQYFAFVGLIKRRNCYGEKFLNPKVVIDLKDWFSEQTWDLPEITPSQDDDIEFVSDLAKDFKRKLIPMEDILIRLQNGPSEDRINKALTKIDKKIREDFEQLLIKIVKYRQAKLNGYTYMFDEDTDC